MRDQNANYRPIKIFLKEAFVRTIYREKDYFFPLNSVKGEQSAEEWRNAETTDTDCHPHPNGCVLQTLKVTLSGVDEAQCCLNPARTTVKSLHTSSALQTSRSSSLFSFVFSATLC